MRAPRSKASGVLIGVLSLLVLSACFDRERAPSDGPSYRYGVQLYNDFVLHEAYAPKSIEEACRAALERHPADFNVDVPSMVLGCVHEHNVITG